MIAITQTNRWLRSGGTGADSVSGPLALLLVMTVFACVPAPLAFADTAETYVVCPAPIREGHKAFMQVRKPGSSSLTVTVFTNHDDYTADSSDFATYDGQTLSNDSGKDIVWVPVTTREDYLPEYDETFSIGFREDGTWRGCVVRILDDDSPEVTGVEITSTPALGNTYLVGESINVAVNFDQEVEVDGSPVQALYVGDDDAWRGASYFRGSGTATLTFRYRVQVIDSDTDGVSVGSASVDADRNAAHGFSGDILAKGTGVRVDYTHSGLGDASAHQVDGRPRILDVDIISAPPGEWEAYRVNQVVETSVWFSADVEVEGDVSLKLYVGFTGENWDDARRFAPYLRGSGSDRLVFAYTVKPGDMDQRGIMIGSRYPGTIFGGDGKLQGKGTDVEPAPFFWGTGHLRNQRVDTAPPIISSINLESRPRNGEAYRVGERIEVEVAFSEQVTSTGPLQLELDIGGVTRRATRQSPSERGRDFSDTILFRYTVQDGDCDSDGLGISANSLKLNGGAIQDRAGNAGGLSHNTIVADLGQRVAACHES